MSGSSFKKVVFGVGADFPSGKLSLTARSSFRVLDEGN